MQGRNHFYMANYIVLLDLSRVKLLFISQGMFSLALQMWNVREFVRIFDNIVGLCRVFTFTWIRSLPLTCVACFVNFMQLFLAQNEYKLHANSVATVCCHMQHVNLWLGECVRVWVACVWVQGISQVANFTLENLLSPRARSCCRLSPSAILSFPKLSKWK